MGVGARWGPSEALASTGLKTLMGSGKDSPIIPPCRNNQYFPLPHPLTPVRVPSVLLPGEWQEKQKPPPLYNDLLFA